MVNTFLNFIRGVSINRFGQAGVILTTTAFFGFILFEMFRLVGVLENAYIGLITYLLFPFLFIIGLIFIPIGWYLYKKKRKKNTKELLHERFGADLAQARRMGSKIFLTILGLSILNIFFISLAGFRTLKFMDGSKFCGTACHTVMNPEWVTFQDSPHARVKCVECHVGEGMRSLVNSKLSGLRQMIKSTFKTYQKPIPTPVHQLRPSRDTCEKCHWPQKFYGHRLKIINRYKKDKNTSGSYNTLDLKIDSGKTAARGGIHWHIARENEVRYASVADQRYEMLWVDVRQKNGSFKRFTNKNYKAQTARSEWENIRTMDCVDCHNRATHIYEDPDKAIDDRISKKLINISLPYTKMVIHGAITAKYPNKKMAVKRITNTIKGFYQRKYPDLVQKKNAIIDDIINTAVAIYNRNVFPKMKIHWKTYPNFVGHDRGGGCFRCHNGYMLDAEGKIIPYDCTLCHSILSFEGDTPFKYLEAPDNEDPNYYMHKTLQKEFLKSK